MARLIYDKASLAAAVAPGIKAIVASELDGLVNEVVERAQKEIATRLLKEFASELEVKVESIMTESLGERKVHITVDLRNNGQVLKG